MNKIDIQMNQNTHHIQNTESTYNKMGKDEI